MTRQARLARYQEPLLPKTINTYYDAAWGELAKHFKQVTGLPSPNLDMESGHPKTKQEWLEVYNALSTIYLIGRRQNWLQLHVNGKGQAVFLIHTAQPTDPLLPSPTSLGAEARGLKR